MTRKPFPQILASLIVPLILSWLPLMVLKNEIASLNQVRAADAEKEWISRAQSIGQRLPDLTSVSWWLETAGRRLKDLVEKAPKSRLEDSIRLSLKTLFPRDLGKPRIWAVSFQNDQIDARPPLISERGFETDFKIFFCDLFREMRRETLGLPHALDQKVWEQRLRTTFGMSISSPLFMKASRGKAFHVIFQKKYGLLTWNLIMRDRQPVGAYLIILPTDDREARKGLLACLRYWHQVGLPHSQSIEQQQTDLFPENEGFPNGIYPAFIPFPTRPGKPGGRALLHPQLRKPGPRKLLSWLYRTRRVAPSRQGTNLGYPFLPNHLIGRATKTGKWWGLITPLPPTHNSFCVLTARPPTLPPLFLEKLAGYYAYGLLFFWGLLVPLGFLGSGELHPRQALQSGNFTEPPFWLALEEGFSLRWLAHPGVRAEFTLWFLGLIATTIMLILGAGARLNTDLASNLEHSLRGSLEHAISEIDTGSIRPNTQFLQTCRTVAKNQKFGEQLDTLRSLDEPRQTTEARRLLDTAWAFCASQGLNLTGIMIYGLDKPLTHFDIGNTITAESAKVNSNFHEFLALELLRKYGVGLMSASETAQEKSSSGRAGEKRPTSAAGVMSQLDILENNTTLLDQPDSITPFQIGKIHNTRYYDLISVNGKIRYCLVLIWNQEKAYRSYLREVLAAPRTDDLRLAAFKPSQEGGEAIGGETRDPAMRIIRRKIRQGHLLEKVGQDLVLAFPSQRMPGFILAGVASLLPIQQRLAWEEIRVYGAIGLLLLFVFLAGWGLSQWLAAPIVRMTDGLEKVAGNDLSVSVAEQRHDELGHAGQTLDQMTQWLKERQMMSRFVSPQVLEAVGGGDFTEACQPRKREVALLVSDVRAFTTMSEANPPAVIFSLINNHLQAMTRIIQQQGGAIDRFIGDAIQAVFYPGPGVSMVHRAMRAGYEIMEEHHRINAGRRQRGEFTYGIGVGVEIGEVVTGVLGDKEVRLDFTVLGEPFKHAADLEALSKKGRATLVVCSQAIKSLSEDAFSFIPIEGDDHEPVWELQGLGAAAQSGESEPATSIVPPIPSAVPNTPPTSTGASPQPSPAAEVAPRDGRPEPALKVPQALPLTLPDVKDDEPVSGLSLKARLFPLFWTLPALLIFFAWQNLAGGSADARQQQVRNLLRDDLKLAELTADPYLQISLEFQDLIRRLEAQLPRSHAPASPGLPSLGPAPNEISRVTIRELAELNALFPRLSWVLFKHAPEREMLPSYSNVRSTVMIASGGPSLPFSVNDLETLFSYLKCRLYRVDDLFLENDFNRAFSKKLNVKNLVNLHNQSLRQFSPIKAGEQNRLLFWSPLVSPGFWPTVEHLRRIGNPNTDYWGFLRKSFLGGVLFFLNQEDLTMDLGFRCLQRGFARNGVALAIIPVKGSPKPEWMHPDFGTRK